MKGRRLEPGVPWSISAGRVIRSALLPGGVTLVVQDQGRWLPVRWGAYRASGPLAEGRVHPADRGEYQATVRQAMLEAERAVACDDCGRVIGHDARVEH